MSHHIFRSAHLACGGADRERDYPGIGHRRDCAGETMVGMERFIDGADHELRPSEAQVGH